MTRIQVGTEAELRSALTSHESNLEVELMSRIEVSTHKTIDCRAASLHLIPGVSYAEIAAPWHFNGNYDDLFNHQHVIAFWGTTLRVDAIGLSWYNNRGNMLKAMSPADVSFIGTRWNDIGARLFKPRVPVPTSAADVVYTCPFAMHQRGQTRSTLTVHNNVFERCAMNAAYWAHVFYVECDRISITGCMSTSCGEFLGCEADYIDVRGNTFRNNTPCPLPSGVRRIPNAIYLPKTGIATILNNAFEVGTSTAPQLCVYNGYPDPTRHYIDDNIYRLSHGPIASELNVGTLSATAWRSRGFDTRSSITLDGTLIA